MQFYRSTYKKTSVNRVSSYFQKRWPLSNPKANYNNMITHKVKPITGDREPHILSWPVLSYPVLSYPIPSNPIPIQSDPKGKSMQRSGTEAIRTQIQPSKPKLCQCGKLGQGPKDKARKNFSTDHKLKIINAETWIYLGNEHHSHLSICSSSLHAKPNLVYFNVCLVGILKGGQICFKHSQIIKVKMPFHSVPFYQ